MRTRLPNRRPCITFDQTIDGIDYTLSYGYDPKVAGVRELFINCKKSGTMMEAIMRDAATTVSLALQRGSTPAELANSLTRNPDNSPASPIGVVVDDMVLG